MIKQISNKLDSWFNLLSGFGTERDRTMGTDFRSDGPMAWPRLTALYHDDDLSEKIVATLPQEMTREPFRVLCKGAPPEGEDALNKALEDLDALQRFCDGLIWGRLYGGCVLYPGIDDGSTDELQPLQLEQVRAINDRLLDFDARYALPDSAIVDPDNVQIYRLENVSGGLRRRVHRSRLLFFRGAHTSKDERLRLLGWDYSVLQRCFEAVRQFNQSHKSSELMMTEGSQPVVKLKGLIDAIAEGKKDDLRTRGLMLDQSRSVSRTLLLDLEEEFEKVPSTFGGIPEVMDRFANRLAAASGIPVTRLMGQAPAGLNATGASDIRAWYDHVRSRQNRDLKPRILWLARVVAKAKGLPAPTDVKFASLWQESDRERAEREELESRSDQIYMVNKVRTNADVALDRFGATIPVAAPAAVAAPTASSQLPQTPTGTAAPAVPGQAPQGPPGQASGPGSP